MSLCPLPHYLSLGYTDGCQEVGKPGQRLGGDDVGISDVGTKHVARKEERGVCSWDFGGSEILM